MAHGPGYHEKPMSHMQQGKRQPALPNAHHTHPSNLLFENMAILDIFPHDERNTTEFTAGKSRNSCSVVMSGIAMHVIMS